MWLLCVCARDAGSCAAVTTESSPVVVYAVHVRRKVGFASPDNVTCVGKLRRRGTLHGMGDTKLPSRATSH